MAQPWQKIEEGIRARPHATRKHGVKPDMYFSLRFTVDGVRKEEALGWASEGWTLAKARAELARLKEAARTGKGPVTLGEARAQAKAARDAERDKPTVQHLWEVYEAAHAERASAKTDKYNFAHLAALAGKTPDEIRTAHVDAVRRTLEKAGKSPQTVKHVLALLRRIIRYGAKRGLCVIPDISRLHFDMPTVNNQKTECLTPEQAKTLLTVLDEETDQNLASVVRLALATGMRRGALLGLQWNDLDFDRNIITLRSEEAKNGRTEHLPMSEAARGILENIEPSASPYLFPGKDGSKRHDIRRFIDRIRLKAGFPKDFRPLHGLRHTYASWMASSGKVDFYTLQKLLNHGSSAMTQRYAHLADEALKRGASVIDECLDLAVNAEPTPPKPKATITRFRKK